MIDEEGIMTLKTQLSPQNPDLFEIPLEELLEEFIGKRVALEVVKTEPLYTTEDG